MFVGEREWLHATSNGQRCPLWRRLDDYRIGDPSLFAFFDYLTVIFANRNYARFVF
jgi:hypothetical protein